MRPAGRRGGRVLALLLGLSLVSGGSGCAFLRKHMPRKRARPAPAARKSAAQPKKVDHRAQRRAYDLGVRYFSEEKYLKARDAWKRALRRISPPS